MDAVIIGLIGLGGLYTIASQDKDKNKNEGFSNKLPNTKTPSINYPMKSVNSVDNNINNYPSSNASTDKYFNADLYNKLVTNNSNDGAFLPEENPMSLKGNQIDKSKFKHNNMVPFFGGKVRGRGANLNTAEGILDNMAGSGSQIIKKKEIAPLFKPEDNVQWAHGAPNNSEFYRSRVNPSMSMNNVKPWEEERVGPSMAGGTTNEGVGGFNSGMFSREQCKPKTVDDLRVATNPKVTYSLNNHQGPATAGLTSLQQGAVQQQIGKVEKHLPDTYFVNTPERYLTTTGLEKGQTSRAINLMPYENRQDTSVQYEGIATGDYKKAKTYENYDPSSKEQLGGDYYGNPRANQPVTESDYNVNSYNINPNNRTTEGTHNIFGNVQSAIGAVIAPVMDILRPSRKENFIGNKRQSGNVQGYGAGASYIINPNDTLKTTNKEMTVNSKNHLNVQNQGNGNFINNNVAPTLTQRNTTSCFYTGDPGSSNEGHMLTDKYERQRNNNNKTSYGYTPTGNTNQFNANINMSIPNRKVENNRAPLGTFSNTIPSTELHGKIHAPQYYDQCQMCDRIQPDVLDAFKKNPFTHSLTSAV